jgi:hypothetical protein
MTGPNNKEELLNETLRLARRHRRIRRVRRASGVFAAIAVIVVTAVWRSPRGAGELLQPASQGHQLTITQPLPAGYIVSTRPFAVDQMVISAARVGMVQTTTTSGGYNELGDDELLALAPEPAALVRRGPREAELFFVSSSSPEDSGQN